MSLYDAGFDDGRKSARRELKPLIEAVQDAIFMFEDIEKARDLPAFGNVQQQYVAMGNQLRRLLDLSGLKDDVR